MSDCKVERLNLYTVPDSNAATPKAVVDEWNREIREKFAEQLKEQPLAAPFLKNHPSELEGDKPAVPVFWPANPAEPKSCQNDEWAEKLSDWGERGRSEFHNEYCEYVGVYRQDAEGKRRLKRIAVTTELPEYWLAMAAADPEFLKRSAEEVLGFTVTYDELYGNRAPQCMSPEERRKAFAVQTSGHCNEKKLVDAHVPAVPVGRLNIDHALFMRHPINGLDDLIYIVAFGAQPYASSTRDGPTRAALHDIFRHSNVLQLACRNADPAAAEAAYNLAVMQVLDVNLVEGATMAFADPLGVYIHSFGEGVFSLNGQAIPPEWIRRSRGVDGKWQRLEFGPDDNDNRFLDEADVEDVAGELRKVTSGYLAVKRIEVGPIVIQGTTQDFSVPTITVRRHPGNLNCREAKICEKIERLKLTYEEQAALEQTP